MHLLLASASFPTGIQHTKPAEKFQPNLVEVLRSNFCGSRTLCGPARPTCMKLACRLHAAAPRSAAVDAARPTCMKVKFWVASLAGPGHFLDAACALLADVVQVSSRKSAFKARAKIQLDLVEL